MATNEGSYPASLEIDYVPVHDRLTSFFRLVWSIPAVVILTILSSPGNQTFMHEASTRASTSGSDITVGLFAVTALMILFRRRYPRWWFDFGLELNRFSTRVSAYLLLLTDQYPSTVEQQAVHLDIAYPDVEKDLNRWLPLAKWFLAIPHYLVLILLIFAAVGATIAAWFAILVTGKYPKGLFDFVVGVGRWGVRVTAYAFLLTTVKYPPFSLT